MADLNIKFGKNKINFDILPTYSKNFNEDKLKSKSEFTHQLIMDLCYLIALILDFHSGIDGLQKVFLLK